MKSHHNLGILAFAGACVVPCASASASDVPRLELSRSSGEVTFHYVGGDGKTRTATLGPLIVESVSAVRGFAPVENRTDAWQADGVRVEMEKISDRAVAVQWTLVDGATQRLTLKVHGNHASFGSGERFNTLNLHGHVLDMVSTDHPEPKGGVSYKPVPFYMSAAGYGVWVDSFLPGRFDFNASDRWAVTMEYTAAELRVVLIAGPKFADMLDEFTRMTGRPRVPPEWAFGLWKSRDVHANRDDVLEDVEMLRKHDIPASVLVIDSPWETGYNDFEMNREQFVEPEKLFARVTELGFNVCFWMTPFINVENVQDMTGIDAGPTRTYAEAARRGFLVTGDDGQPVITSWWKGKGALVDFTNPDATAWWQGQLEKTLQWGGRAFKCDDGEGDFISTARFADGSPAAAMKNRYSMLYLAATRDFLDQALDGDGTIIGRSGFAGMHTLAMGWAGDNAADWSLENGLPSVILASQSAALSGMPYWGSDIAGYMGRPTKELFIRWTQFACFTPQMMVHMTSNLGPWDFDDETLAIFRDYARLHTRLFPYMNHAAHVSAAMGMPVIRPMVLAFQDDPASWSHVFQFMFGDDLLVAPMYAPGTRRSLYLPKGDWVDWWTGNAVSGPQIIEVEAPLERMPLFVRSGAVIELLPDDVDTLIRRREGMATDVVALDERRVLQVWPGARGEVASSDGVSATLTRTGNSGKLVINCSPPRPLAVELMHCEPKSIAASDIQLSVQQLASPHATTVLMAGACGSAVLEWIE